MSGPLAGVTVLDLTRVLSGPYCTMVLADLGARVIKVEHPGKGDDTRHWGPPFVGDESAYFLSINRNKESVCARLQAPGGTRRARAAARPRRRPGRELQAGHARPCRLRVGRGARAVAAPDLRLDLGLRTDRPAPQRARLRRRDPGGGRLDERHRRRRRPGVSAGRRDLGHRGRALRRAGRHGGAVRARADRRRAAGGHRHARHDGGAAHLPGRQLLRHRATRRSGWAIAIRPSRPTRPSGRRTARSSSPSATTGSGGGSAPRSGGRSWPRIRDSRPTATGWRTTPNCRPRSKRSSSPARGRIGRRASTSASVPCGVGPRRGGGAGRPPPARARDGRRRSSIPPWDRRA